MFFQSDHTSFLNTVRSKHRGVEGHVFIGPSGLAGEEVAVKFRMRTADKGAEGVVLANRAVAYKKDLLSEHRRRAVHRAITAICPVIELSESRMLWYGGEKMQIASLIHLSQASIDSYYSSSVMTAVSGKPCFRAPLRLYNDFRDLGVAVDIVGKNNVIRLEKKSCDHLVVLETLGGIHMEALRYVSTHWDTYRVEERGQIIHCLASAYHLNGITQWPTPPIEAYFVAENQSNGSQLDIKSFWRMLANWNISKSADSKTSELCERERQRARKVFGQQYIPKSFEWGDSKSLENYGINQSIFNALQSRIIKISPAYDAIKRYAERAQQIRLQALTEHTDARANALQG